MATPTLILIFSIIALLSGVVVVQLLRNQHDLLDKNEALIREIRENLKLHEELRKAWQKLQKGTVALLLLLIVGACHKEDETLSVETVGETEICIFFAPNELGDFGYADQLLSVLYKLESSLTEDELKHTMLHFITESDSSILHRTLKDWNRLNVNLNTRKRYDRRLMILSHPMLLNMLEGTVPDSTSEVLVMNASNELFSQTPHREELGPRLHLLSISAAEAGRKFLRMVEATQLKEWQEQKQIWLLQQFDDHSAMADSIGIVCYEYIMTKPETMLLTLAKYTLEKGTITLGDAYKIAHMLPLGQSESDFGCFTLCGWGKHNAAISSLIMSKGLGDTQVTFLDTDIPTLDNICHNIIRHYDRALLDWLQRWLKAEPATMPEREWHGAWDGYVSDDFGE